MKTFFLAFVFALLVISVRGKNDECVVCVNVLQKFVDYAGEDTSDVEKSEIALKAFCKTLTGKEDRFCYYIGASDTSATRIITEVTKPLSYGKPVEKICKDLNKKDSQICELKYEEKIDLANTDLWSLPVKKLKKILTQWGEQCRGCVEKGDLIAKINTLKESRVEL